MVGGYSQDLQLRPVRPLAGFWSDRGGSVAVEYALIAGGIFLAIVIVVPEIGTAVNAMFTDVKNGF